MGGRNQIYRGTNPNMKNLSYSSPQLFNLAIDMLVEQGIYQSRSEVIRDGIRRILKDNLHIIDALSHIIEYKPIKRAKQHGNTCYTNNGYEIIEKGMNEQ